MFTQWSAKDGREREQKHNTSRPSFGFVMIVEGRSVEIDTVECCLVASQRISYTLTKKHQNIKKTAGSRARHNNTTPATQ